MSRAGRIAFALGFAVAITSRLLPEGPVLLALWPTFMLTLAAGMSPSWMQWTVTTVLWAINGITYWAGWSAMSWAWSRNKVFGCAVVVVIVAADILFVAWMMSS